LSNKQSKNLIGIGHTAAALNYPVRRRVTQGDRIPILNHNRSTYVKTDYDGITSLDHSKKSVVQTTLENLIFKKKVTLMVKINILMTLESSCDPKQKPLQPYHNLGV